VVRNQGGHISGQAAARGDNRFQTGTFAQERIKTINAVRCRSRGGCTLFFRTLVGAVFPRTKGSESAAIVVPKHMINPAYPAWQSGKPKCHSQCRTCFYGAAGVDAGSQGTINNLLR